MALSKIQKISLSFGMILMWADQISDVVMSILYYKSCHVKWAIASFILTFLQNILIICAAIF